MNSLTPEQQALEQQAFNDFKKVCDERELANSDAYDQAMLKLSSVV